MKNSLRFIGLSTVAASVLFAFDAHAMLGRHKALQDAHAARVMAPVAEAAPDMNPNLAAAMAASLEEAQAAKRLRENRDAAAAVEEAQRARDAAPPRAGAGAGAALEDPELVAAMAASLETEAREAAIRKTAEEERQRAVALAEAERLRAQAQAAQGGAGAAPEDPELVAAMAASLKEESEKERRTRKAGDILYTIVDNCLQKFIFDPIKGDGNCGFYTFDLTREAAVNLLLEGAENATLRNYVAPEIWANAMRNELPQAFLDHPGILRILRENRSGNTLSALCCEANERGTKSALYKDIDAHFRSIAGYKTYIEESYGKMHAYLEHGRMGAAESTTILDALALLCNRNVSVWKEVNGRLERHHKTATRPGATDLHILYDGRNHYDRLIPLPST